MTLPNFLIIGAQKAGTTSFYYYLGQHPEVFMSPVKEPHFFDHGDEKPDYGGPGSIPGPEYSTIEEYRELFREVSTEKAVGEASPTYLYLPGAAERIRRRLPDARLIAVLRDPAERAYSAYLHAFRGGREPLDDFRDALGEEEARIQAGWHHLYHYKNRGFYHAQLSRYHKLFGPERVRAYLHEDLRADPVGVARDAFRFLEVDEAFEPDASVRYNATGVPKNGAITALVRSFNDFTPTLKKILPFGARQRVKSLIFAKPPPLDPTTRGKLVESYREDILALQDRLGRDLSAWLAS